tara:strand:+ start:457 stop:1605 length:1149 start_codon:yes stop_codon:yes gene_type:complete
MAAPILAGIGKMFTGVVAGTARGIAMGARATATTAKSGGRLVQSASNVKSNIVKSNKKIRKIKLNRRRINKSIFSEQKRRAREKQLESRKKSNKKGLFSSPLAAAGGIRQFIYTLLFGLAITNIENIKKFFDNVGEGISNFGTMIQDWYDNTIFVLTLGTIDGKKLRKDRDTVDKEIDKLKFALDSLNIDTIQKLAHKVGSGWYMKPKTAKDIKVEDPRKGFGFGGNSGMPLALDPHIWRAALMVIENEEAWQNELRKMELMGDDYDGPLKGAYFGPTLKRKQWANLMFFNMIGLHPLNPAFLQGMLLNNNPEKDGIFTFNGKTIGNKKAVMEWLQTTEGKTYLRKVKNNQSIIEKLNSSTDNDNTVIINKTVIEKKYIPVK